MASDPTLARDAMLTRMAMATPGGPLFPMTGRGSTPIQEKGYQLDKDESLNLDKFDEAQAFARSQAAVRASRGLITHPMLLNKLAVAAVYLREQLEAGETVLIVTSGGQELARFEP